MVIGSLFFICLKYALKKQGQIHLLSRQNSYQPESDFSLQVSFYQQDIFAEELHHQHQHDNQDLHRREDKHHFQVHHPRQVRHLHMP